MGNLPMGRGRPEDLANPVVHIAWPHRWEHDKDPEAFFRVIFKLLEEGIEFKVSVIGQTYGQLPGVFKEARQKLGGRIVTWGFKADKEEFYSALSECNVVVSTAQHETYGVAMKLPPLAVIHLCQGDWSTPSFTQKSASTIQSN